MSTKIYNAYKFDKQYSMFEIMALFDPIRKQVEEAALTFRDKYIVSRMVYYLDYRTFFGVETVRKQIDKQKTKSPRALAQKEIWEILAEDEVDKCSLKHAIIREFEERTKAATASLTIADSDFDLSCQVCLIPMKTKTLMMYFGNDDLKEIVTNQSWLLDYHYQNQTDRPKNITARQWNQRKKDWDIALGPDGVPANHSMSIHLLRTGMLPYMPFRPNFTEDYIPDMPKRVREIVECIEDPNAPETNSVSEIIEYMRSDAFLSWKKEREQEVSEKLPTYIIKNLFD